MLLLMFVGGWKIRNDQTGVRQFGNIQKALYGLFHTKKVQQQSYARNVEALVPKNNQKVDQNTLEIGRKLGRANVEVLQDVLNKGVYGKAETVLEVHFKEADHLGNLDYIRGEKIREPDLNARRGSIVGYEGFFIKGLNLTMTHGVRILHGSSQIFETARVPNLTNFSLTFSKQGRVTHWSGSINHSSKTTESPAGLS